MLVRTACFSFLPNLSNLIRYHFIKLSSFAYSLHSTFFACDQVYYIGTVTFDILSDIKFFSCRIAPKFASLT